MIVVLTGGTGGAKFIDGLRMLVAPEELTVIVNTGDDHRWWNLFISPDTDSITYVLAGILSEERGWGVRLDTFHCLDMMKRLGEPAWFAVGDRDLAVHVLRSRLVAEGKTLSEATAIIAERLGVRSRILPMSDMRVETRIGTPRGELGFEEYFVERRYQDPVEWVRFAGATEAAAAPGVLEAIAGARAVVIAPSNPITSIGPILAVPGVRRALTETSAAVVAVSPIIGNSAVSGPAAHLMATQELPVSAVGIAQAYEDFLHGLVIDSSDRRLAPSAFPERLRIHATDILMRTSEDRRRVARAALECARAAAFAASQAEMA
jgi:LPPG:FO 2-phospho-L-lactate transferase